MALKYETEVRRGKMWYIIKYQMLYDIRESAVQILVDKKLIWFPISQVILYKHSQTIEVPEWLFQEKFLKGGKR